MGRFAPARLSERRSGEPAGTAEREFDHDSSLNSVEEQQDPGPDGQQRDSGGSHLVAARSEGVVVRLGS